jgi:hypothetical protein
LIIVGVFGCFGPRTVTLSRNCTERLRYSTAGIAKFWALLRAGFYQG